jgi:hypothetical protein
MPSIPVGKAKWWRKRCKLVECCYWRERVNAVRQHWRSSLNNKGFSEAWSRAYSGVLSKGVQRGIEQGVQQDSYEVSRRLARRLLDSGLSVAQVAEAEMVELPLSDVELLADRADS